MAQNGIDLRSVNFGKYSKEHSTLARRTRALVAGAVPFWQRDGLLQRKSTHFAVVAKIFPVSNLGAIRDFLQYDPDVAFDFAYCSGSTRVATNALCMVHATIRAGRSTLNMNLEEFQDVVAVDEHSIVHTWGELPLGGAVIIQDDDTYFVVGVYGFLPWQNHWLAETLARFMALDRKHVSSR